MRLSVCGFTVHTAKTPRLARWRSANYGLVIATGEPAHVLVDDEHVTRMLPGEALVLFPGRMHAYGHADGRSTWPHAALLVDGPVLDGLRADGSLDPRAPIRRLRHPARVYPIFKRLMAADERDLPPLVFELFSMAIHGEAVLTLPERPAHPVDALLQELASDPLHAWDFAAEARRLDMTEVHLRRLVKARTGDPPTRHLARLRMHAAGRMLLAGATATEAAVAVGMHDPAHFSRRFTQLMGASPSAWLAAERSRAP